MQNDSSNPPSSVSRRQFLKTSSAFAASAAAAASFPSVVYAQASQPINAVVIGLGSRGSGAGRDFLEGAKLAGATARIVAAADLFPDKANAAVKLAVTIN